MTDFDPRPLQFVAVSFDASSPSRDRATRSSGDMSGDDPAAATPGPEPSADPKAAAAPATPGPEPIAEPKAAAAAARLEEDKPGHLGSTCVRFML